MPKIGPPQIIKYQRESEQVPISQKYKDAAHVVGQELDFDFNDFDSADLSEEEDKELEARIRGKFTFYGSRGIMFSGCLSVHLYVPFS